MGVGDTRKLCSGNRLQWDTLECAVPVWLFVAGTTLKNFKVMKLRIPRITWFLCAMKKQDGYFPGKQGIHLLMTANIITNIFIKYPKWHKISHIYITMIVFLKSINLQKHGNFGECMAVPDEHRRRRYLKTHVSRHFSNGVICSLQCDYSDLNPFPYKHWENIRVTKGKG